MSQSSDTLHLDGVHLLQRMVKNTRRVYDLPPKVFIVEVANKKRLGCESVWLNIDIGTSDLVDERGFSDIGISTDQKRPGVWIDGRKTGDVLANLLKVSKWVFLSAHDGSHTSGEMRVD